MFDCLKNKDYVLKILENKLFLIFTNDYFYNYCKDEIYKKYSLNLNDIKDKIPVTPDFICDFIKTTNKEKINDDILKGLSFMVFKSLRDKTQMFLKFDDYIILEVKY